MTFSSMVMLSAIVMGAIKTYDSFDILNSNESKLLYENIAALSLEPSEPGNAQDSDYYRGDIINRCWKAVVSKPINCAEMTGCQYTITSWDFSHNLYEAVHIPYTQVVSDSQKGISHKKFIYGRDDTCSSNMRGMTAPDPTTSHSKKHSK